MSNSIYQESYQIANPKQNKLNNLENKNALQKNAHQVAKELDTYFISHLVKLMHDKIEPDPIFGGGNGERIFSDFLLDQYVEKMASRMNIIGDVVANQLTKLQKNNTVQEKSKAINIVQSKANTDNTVLQNNLINSQNLSSKTNRFSENISDIKSSDNISYVKKNHMVKNTNHIKNAEKYSLKIEDIVREDGIDEVI